MFNIYLFTTSLCTGNVHGGRSYTLSPQNNGDSGGWPMGFSLMVIVMSQWFTYMETYIQTTFILRFSFEKARGDISTQVWEPRAQTPQALSPKKWQHLHWPCPTSQARRRECSWREYRESLVTGGGQWQVSSPGKSGLCSCVEWEAGDRATKA